MLFGLVSIVGAFISELTFVFIVSVSSSQFSRFIRHCLITKKMIDHINVPKTAKPVFVKAECLPNKLTVVELLDTILAVIGRGSIAAAWKQSGTWLIYPWTEEARAKMITNMFNINGRQFELDGSDPSHIPAVGEFNPRTKLVLSNLPLEVSNPDIGRFLSEAGFILRSPVKHDVIRTKSGDEAMGGKRFVYIDLPKSKTNKHLKIGRFTAFLYYKEMEDAKATCRQCLQPGHRAKDCRNEPVCFTCKKPGHKRGDPRCDLGIESVWQLDDSSSQTHSKEANATFVKESDRGSEPPIEKDSQSNDERKVEDHDEQVLASGGEDADNGTPLSEPLSEMSGPGQEEDPEKGTDSVQPKTPKGAMSKSFAEVAASTPSKNRESKKTPIPKVRSKAATPTSTKSLLQTSLDRFGALKRRLGDRSPPSPSASQDDGSAKRQDKGPAKRPDGL